MEISVWIPTWMLNKPEHLFFPVLEIPTENLRELHSSFLSSREKRLSGRLKYSENLPEAILAALPFPISCSQSGGKSQGIR